MKTINIKMNLKYIIIVILSVSSFYGYAQFQEPASYLSPKKIVTIDASKGKNDTKTFQKAIETVHTSGGGHVIVEKGMYSLMNVELLSDVHILFKECVVIEPNMDQAEAHKRTGLKSGNVFVLGRKEQVENVSIIGSQNNMLIDFTKETGMLRGVSVGNCKNFKISNITIDDNKTVFSGLILGWAGEKNGVGLIPTDGLVENFKAINAHYGYGSIQAQSGRNIIFKNIESIGGVAVRLETGYKKMNDSGTGGLFNIYAENIVSRKGQAALFLQAHTLDHGDIVAKNISAYGSEFAVGLESAFVSKKKYSGDNEKTPGTFKSVTIDGVKAVYEDGPIETRYSHLDEYPIELHPKIYCVETNEGKQYYGPSIAAVANLFKQDNNVKITNVEAIGFKYHPDIITEKDLFKGNIRALANQTKSN